MAKLVFPLSHYVSHVSSWCGGKSSGKVHVYCMRVLWLFDRNWFLLLVSLRGRNKQIKSNCNCDKHLFPLTPSIPNTIFDDCNQFNAYLMANISFSRNLLLVLKFETDSLFGVGRVCLFEHRRSYEACWLQLRR